MAESKRARPASVIRKAAELAALVLVVSGVGMLAAAGLIFTSVGDD